MRENMVKMGQNIASRTSLNDQSAMGKYCAVRLYVRHVLFFKSSAGKFQVVCNLCDVV
jgi:hypothetical protein